MACDIELINKIKAFFDEKEWKYNYDEKNALIRMFFDVSDKIRKIQIIIDLNYDDCYIVLSPFPMNATESNYTQILRLINYANFSSKFGNYELDENDGEIRYRMTVDCDGILPSSNMLERIVGVPTVMTRKYGKPLMDIIMDNKSFEEVKYALETRDNS